MRDKIGTVTAVEYIKDEEIHTHRNLFACGEVASSTRVSTHSKCVAVLRNTASSAIYLSPETRSGGTHSLFSVLDLSHKLAPAVQPEHLDILALMKQKLDDGAITQVRDALRSEPGPFIRLSPFEPSNTHSQWTNSRVNCIHSHIYNTRQ